MELLETGWLVLVAGLYAFKTGLGRGRIVDGSQSLSLEGDQKDPHAYDNISVMGCCWRCGSHFGRAKVGDY